MKRILLLFTLIITIVGDSYSQWITAVPAEKELRNTYYQVGYNTSSGTPGYVAYRLYFSLTDGTEPRGTFKTDRRAPGITPSLYVKSGYDRGHMAPSADFRGTKTGVSESFLMTNIAPQTAALNRGPWKTVEDRIRKSVTLYDTIYVVMGPIGKTGTIASRRIVVPERFWKVAVGVKKGSASVIGVWIFTNTRTPKSRKVTLPELEEILGRELYPGMWFNKKLGR